MTRPPPTNELSQKAYDYLLSRHYTDELILKDRVISRDRGRHVLLGQEVKLHAEHLLWPCLSMGGALAGWSTANLEEKDYNFRRNKSMPWLANFFANEDDLDGIYERQVVVLCEGAFDRVALKTVLDLPVMARLTRGVGRDLTAMLARYVRKVYLMFDNDDAGRLGTESARKRIGAFATVIPIPYPAKDPAEFLSRVGPASFKRHFDAKMELYW